MEDRAVQYASFWQRFLASLIDLLIVLVIQCVLLIPFIGIMGYEMSFNELGDLRKGTILILSFGLYLTFMLISWLYFALFHASLNHATIGKMIVGIKLCHAHRRDLSFSRMSLRYVSQYMSFSILLIGFIMAAFTPKRQALHDFIANTIVIKK